MAALKYSRQRESIKHFLMTTKKHPTADEVYMHVKKETFRTTRDLVCVQKSESSDRYRRGSKNFYP